MLGVVGRLGTATVGVRQAGQAGVVVLGDPRSRPSGHFGISTNAGFFTNFCQSNMATIPGFGLFPAFTGPPCIQIRGGYLFEASKPWGL